MSIYFITGIDTDIGKTYATAFLVDYFYKQYPNQSIITQKLIQTGNTGISEDIKHHRKLTNTPLTPMDNQGITCPYVLSTPASPHLASQIDNVIINTNHITHCTHLLTQQYDTILLEGAGGVFVPLTDDLLMLDYIADLGYPVILVTCGRLGSINHTLLSLEAIKNRGLSIYALVYNHYFDDKTISPSTQQFLKNYLARHFNDTLWLDMPTINNTIQNHNTNHDNNANNMMADKS